MNSFFESTRSSNDRVWFHPTTYSCQEESNICISRESNLGEQAAHPLRHHDLLCLILTLKIFLGGVKSEAASSEILVSPDHLVMKLSKVVHYFETQFRRKTPISGNLFHFLKTGFPLTGFISGHLQLFLIR